MITFWVPKCSLQITQECRYPVYSHFQMNCRRVSNCPACSVEHPVCRAILGTGRGPLWVSSGILESRLVGGAARFCRRPACSLALLKVRFLDQQHLAASPKCRALGDLQMFTPHLFAKCSLCYWGRIPPFPSIRPLCLILTSNF